MTLPVHHLGETLDSRVLRTHLSLPCCCGSLHLVAVCLQGLPGGSLYMSSCPKGSTFDFQSVLPPIALSLGEDFPEGTWLFLMLGAQSMSMDSRSSFLALLSFRIRFFFSVDMANKLYLSCFFCNVLYQTIQHHPFIWKRKTVVKATAEAVKIKTMFIQNYVCV